MAASPDDPLIGRTLPGGYLILELVGIGGMGRVYRAEQTTLVRTVAVKIIHPHLVGEESTAARFITEARAASRLNHPNSVGIIDFGKTPDGQLYLVMEFLRGRDLARVTHEDGALPFRRIIDVLRQTLAALAEAHSENIIHRDLKPENIILEPVRAGGDFVKVVDFGLAKMRAETQQPGITSPGIVCGTPEYMSPEQARGDPLDARSDLYSVGVILYQLTAGRLPFEADSPTQVVLAHLTEPPRDPRLVAPERQIPAALVDVTLKALAKNQKDRFQDADEFAAELTRVLAQMAEGAQVGGAPAVAVRCGSCGALNPSTQKFCGECGASTTSTQMVPVPPRTPTPPPPTREAYGSDRPPAAGDRSRVQWPLPFIAREEDLAWLEGRRADARSLTGARLVGDVGVGKTRLIREFLDFAATAGDVVVQTGPDPAWAEVGCWTLRQAIVRLAVLPPMGGSARDWVGATPEARRGLGDVFGHESPGHGKGLSPEERRFAAAEGAPLGPRPRERAGTRAPRRPRRRRPALGRRREPQRLLRRAERPAACPGAAARGVRARVRPGLARRSRCRAHPHGPAEEPGPRGSRPVVEGQLAGVRVVAHRRAALRRAAPALPPRGGRRRPRHAGRHHRRPRRAAPGPTRGGRHQAVAVWGDDADDSSSSTEMLDDERRSASRRSRSCGAQG